MASKERRAVQILLDIEEAILVLAERINKMAKNQADLDASLATFAVALKAVQDAIASKTPSNPPVAEDLTPEVTDVDNATAALNQIAAQIPTL